MKFYPRFSFLLIVFLSAFAVSVFGQTITIGVVDPGPYAPGSNIAVPITVNTSGGCTTSSTIYKLYLSDATGSFASRVLIGQFNSFYATFVNGTIPSTGITPGGNYKILVESSSPTITSASTAINIVAGTAVTAGILGSSINTSNPEVYGQCSGSANYGFIFDNSTSTTGSTVNATFHDEYTPNATPDVNVGVAPNGTFTAAATNYTIFVKATKGGITGTKAYMLINNVVNTNFGTSGTTSICQGSSLTFTVDITSPTGIQKNFPGNTYNVTWGDGSTHAYTFCEIKTAGGTITHGYTTSSCGKTSNGQNNVFEVDLLPKSPYCTSIANPVTSYAKVSAPPSNTFSSNTSGGVTCTGNTVTFSNNSYPGEDPNSVSSTNCSFAGAAYAWYVDGALIKANASLSTLFTYPFTTTGTHTITLHLQNNPSTCPVADYIQTICVQDSPTPSFTVPSPALCLSGGTASIIPTTTFTINNACYTNPYKWTLKNGTTTVATSTLTNPTFNITTSGIYTLDLGVTDACGTVKNAPQKQIVVNAPPTATFAKTAQTYCGTQNLTFNNTAGSNTQITYAGTADAGGNYVWTVTPAGGAAAATFVSPSTSTSQYPQIKFPGVGSYAVSVKYTNGCGVTTSNTETIKIQQAPSVVANANPSETICASAGSFQTAGSISDMTSVTSYKWLTSGDGTFTPSATSSSLTPVYSLGPNDQKGGTITLTLDVATNLVGSCADIKQSFNLIITPADKFSPANTTTASSELCSGNHFNYTIKTANTGATYNWTATVQTGTVTGLSASGSGSVINDDPVNASTTTDAVVVYTITSTTNGCPSTLTYTLTVHPKPVLSGVTPTATMCSGTATNITLPAGMNYTWVASVVTGSASGFTQKTAAGAVASIANTLTNTSNADAVVRYRITPYATTGSCPGDYVDVLVTVSPATTVADADISNATPNPTLHICGTAAPTSKQLNANLATVGTGKWTQPAGQTATIADDTKYNTTVSGLVAGQSYTFTWTISGCSTSSSDITFVVDAPSVGGAALASNGTNKVTVCSGQSTDITLSGNVGTVQRWEKTTDNGNTWATVTPGSVSGNTYTFNNLLQNASYRAVVLNGSCTSATSSQVDVSVNPPTPTPVIISSSNLSLCNQSTITVTGSLPNGYTGQWVQITGPTVGITIVSPTSPTTDITGLQGGNNYKFAWFINGVSPCSPSNQAIVTVTDQAGINNTISYSGNIVCQGATVTLSNVTASGGNGLLTYKWESSIDAGNTWAVISGETQQNINVIVGQKTMYRRTITSGQCDQISNIITVDIQQVISNNVISGLSTEICFKTSPASPVTGNLPSGGDNVNFIYQWQQSTDNGATYSDITGATGQNYQPGVLSLTTLFRRKASTNTCVGGNSNFSNAFKIIVDPAITANFTAQTITGCAPYNINQITNGSSNIAVVADPNIKTYEWYADGILLSSSSSSVFPGYTIQNNGQTVNIQLKVINAIGCESSKTIAFTTGLQVIGSFTMTNVTVAPGTSCSGDQTFQFTNTSTPLNATTYTWDFGNGQTSTSTNPTNRTFVADANTGADKVYTIKLTPAGCSSIPATQIITVYPAIPVAVILLDAVTGCAPFDITVHNKSLGTNVTQYKYYLIAPDNVTIVKTIIKTDKTDAVFTGISPASLSTYTIYMEATNNCGKIGTSQKLPVTISPSIITERMTVNKINGNVSGCAPFFTSFQNLSTGGTQYIYNIYKKSDFSLVQSIPINGSADGNYNFTIPGEYYVKVLVQNACLSGGAKESDPVYISVFPSAAPAFAATTATTGCTQLTVSFTNTTPNISATASASSFTYTWDFGDGSPTYTGFTPPAHTYDYKRSPYTVTLSVVNNNGCFSSTNRVGYITLNPPPLTDFTAQPDTITTIPNYTFAFVDKTTNAPVSWKWDFGDGTTSNRQNPTHTYADTGRYKVTLTTITQYGCTDTKTHIARITGVPGQLYVPNAFMPTSLSQELRVFTVKGSGLKSYDLRIINNWGQVVFETTKLNTKGEPLEFWDGKYKGQDAPQGVYAWEVSALFINGTDWKGMSYKGSAPKRSGTLTLIR